MKRWPLHEFYEKIWRLNNGALDSESCSPWISLWRIEQGIWLFGMWERSFSRAHKAVKPLKPTCTLVRGDAWDQREQWQCWFRRRISDCGRECGANRRRCDSNKLCHKRKWNTNHYMNSIKIIKRRLWCKAVTPLEPTCTVVRWRARDLREQRSH